MGKKLLFGFSAILAFLFFLSTNSTINVHAATSPLICGPNLDTTRPSGSSYTGSGTYVDSSQSPTYSNPVITYNGSEPVYEKTLSQSDFTLTENYSQPTYQNLYQKYYYESIDPNTPCDTTGSMKIGTVPGTPQTGTTTTHTSSISVSSSGSKQSGTLSFTASYGSASKTVNTYWVKSVSVNSGMDVDIYLTTTTDDDIHTCKITYGDGTVKDCNQGTMDTSATNNLINSIVPGQESTMSSEVTNNLNAFWVANDNNGPLTTPTGYATRISQADLQTSHDNATGGFSGGNQAGNGMVGTYTAKFGILNIYAYVDQYTGASASAYIHRWHVAVADIEDEIRYQNKKEEYSWNAVWHDGHEYRNINLWNNVTCNLYYYGPLAPKNCLDIADQAVENYSYGGYTHVDGTESLSTLIGGGNPTPGNGYRYIKYSISFSDGSYIVSDKDFRTILYATKVQVNGFYEALSPVDAYNPSLEQGTYNSEKEVLVLETHDKGVATPQDYATYEGYVWHAYKETYDDFTYPSCSRTYAPSRVTGFVLTEDCKADEYYLFTDASSYHSTGKEYTYNYGQPAREGFVGYLENGLNADQHYLFHYVTNVDISVSPQKTYQDEPYPNITCTKTYPTYSNAFGIYSQKTLSCLDKMYVQSDTGQSRGGVRQIVYNYVNNTYQDPTEQVRVYAASTGINGATSGKSGYEGKYDSWVNWGDGSTKDISLIPGVWDMKVDNTGESIPYIGRVWGYTDYKGQYHQNSSINDLYIPNPVSGNYRIISTYPVNDGTMGPYSNGLTPGYGLVNDYWDNVSNSIPFHLIGINNLTMTDTPDDYVDPVDLDMSNTGSIQTTKYPNVNAAPFVGFRSPPGYGGYAFNNKTYQTGSWYNYIVTARWDDGSTEELDINSHPELTWRFMNQQGNWSFSQGDYPVGGTNTHMPWSGQDHRLLLDGWNPIRFDIFSESGIPMPSGQSNYLFTQSYMIGNAWAHEAKSVVITGPTVVSDPAAMENYNSYINWSDMTYMNQDTSVHNSNTNPWNNVNRTQVTNNIWTEWFKDTNQLTTPVSGPLQVAFPEFKADGHYRTISTSWGNMHRTLPGFSYWTYLTSQINVYFNGGPNAPACANIVVPTMGCPLPVSDTNYRLPKQNDVSTNRMVEGSLKYTVTGVSTGTGN